METITSAILMTPFYHFSTTTTLSDSRLSKSEMQDDSYGNQNNDWMGWIKGTVQSVGTKVAEKAKSSMDSMITTLDPQMKELISKYNLFVLVW